MYIMITKHMNQIMEDDMLINLRNLTHCLKCFIRIRLFNEVKKKSSFIMICSMHKNVIFKICYLLH